MERHDTHILSSSEEEEHYGKKHKYSFNEFNNSISSSEKISVHSNSKENSPFKLDFLKLNNKRIINNNNLNNDDSIISIKNIDDIFYNEIEKTLSVKETHVNTDNKNEKNNQGDNTLKIGDISYESKKIEINNNEETSLSNQYGKLNLKIKLIKTNYNNKNKNKNNHVTYTPRLKIESISFDNIKKRSTSVSYPSPDSKKFNEKYNNDNTKSSRKSTKSKQLKLSSEYENFNNVNNTNNNNNSSKNLEEDTNMKNLINLLKQKKIKSLKVSKDSFSLNSKKNNPILLGQYPKLNKNKIYIPYENTNRIQHASNFYFEQENNYDIEKTMIPPINCNISKRRSIQCFPQNDNMNENHYYSSKYIVNHHTNSQYCMSSFSKQYHKSKKNTRLKLKNDKKIKILYDLYCGKEDTKVRNLQRIKSALSIKRKKSKKPIPKGITNLNIIKNINYANMKNDNYLNNKNSWLFKLIKLKKCNKKVFPYEKHFGNHENCPLCQEMEKKNEESIIKKGISPNNSAKKNNNNESRTSLQKRRIYSATSKNNASKIKNECKSEVYKENETNRTRNLFTNKNNYNSVMVNKNKNVINNKIINSNMIKRKLKFNRDINHESNFSYSNYINI